MNVARVKTLSREMKMGTPGHPFWKRFAGERGTNLIEMALLTPVLLLLVLGAIEIGRYAGLSILVANAARSGAQYGAQNLVTAADNAGITSAATEDTENTPGGQSLANLSVTSQPVCGCSADGLTNGQCPTTNVPSCGTGPFLVYVQVTATGTFNSLFGYPGIPSSITVSRTAEMPVAQ